MQRRARRFQTCNCGGLLPRAPPMVFAGLVVARGLHWCSLCPCGVRLPPRPLCAGTFFPVDGPGGLGPDDHDTGPVFPHDDVLTDQLSEKAPLIGAQPQRSHEATG